MRHFVAFSLLLFVLEISVVATLMAQNSQLCYIFRDGDYACRVGCLEQLKCQNGHCKKAINGNGKFYLADKICVCEDCPGGQKTEELPGQF